MRWAWVALLTSLALVFSNGCDEQPLTPSGELRPTAPETSPPHLASKLGTVDRDITYGNVDGIALKMDIYYPRISLETTPALVYVHGGGWTSGDKGSGDVMLDTPELLSRGYLVASVNYRLAPQYKFPAQIEDVKCAVRFLRANASAYGIDASRIGVWGGSAGGHLAALLGVTDSNAGFDGSGGHQQESSRVQAVVDLYGPTEFLTSASGSSSKLSIVFGTSDLLGQLALSETLPLLGTCRFRNLDFRQFARLVDGMLPEA